MEGEAGGLVIVTANLERLSLCPCGFPALREHVELGTEYLLQPEWKRMATWECGGCHEVTLEVECVLCWRPGTGKGYLPSRLFEPDVGQGLTPRARTLGA